MVKDKIGEAIISLAQAHNFQADIVQVLPTMHFEHGDYYSNLPLILAKQEKRDPLRIAQSLADSLNKNKPAFLATVTTAAPGFLNFTVCPRLLADELNSLIRNNNTFPEPKIGQNKTVIIEYSAPNIAKQMSVGHLRSTIIGQALVNIYQSLGFTVIATNHLGDWGTQFGKLIVAYKLWGDDQKLAEDPIPHLQDLYVRFTTEAKVDPDLDDKARAEFAKLEHGDKENSKLWQTFRAVSLDTFMKMYERLGTKITYQMGESDYKDQNETVYQMLEKAGLVKHEGNALVLDLADPTIPSTILRKSDDSSVYLTRDIAQIMYRVSRWQPNKILIVVGQEQTLHFRQLFAIARKLDIAEGTELLHVGFGLVLLDGKRMRTREGHTMFLKEVLDEAVAKAQAIVIEKSRALDKAEQAHIAELVGIGSVKYNDLSQNRLTNISFDWDKMLSLDGNSAPYLMYTLARINSVEEKAGVVVKEFPNDCQFEQAEQLLLRQMIRYQDTVIGAMQHNEPHVIATYLYDLAKRYNAFYAQTTILTDDVVTRSRRLTINHAVGKIIADGLKLLDIDYPERM